MIGSSGTHRCAPRTGGAPVAAVRVSAHPHGASQGRNCVRKERGSRSQASVASVACLGPHGGRQIKRSDASSSFQFMPESRKYGSWANQDTATPRRAATDRNQEPSMASRTTASPSDVCRPSVSQSQATGAKSQSAASRSTTRSQQLRDMQDIKMRIAQLTSRNGDWARSSTDGRRSGSTSSAPSTVSYASSNATYDSLPLGCEWSSFYEKPRR